MSFTIKTWLLLMILPFQVLLIGAPALGMPSSKTSYEADTTKLPSRNLLHLHFDRHDYVAGETIWFKAYLIDSKQHLPDPQDVNLYVELYDFTGKEIISRVYRMENGVAHGDLLLDKDIPDGNYFIRAYINTMRNYGEEFLFKKFFYISNPEYSNRISKEELKFNQQFNSGLDHLRSQLMPEIYPEGGNLLAGVENMLVIHLKDGLGKGVGREGSIVSGKGETVTDFNTGPFGYAAVSFTPEANVQYSLNISDLNGQKLVKDLAPGITKGVNLKFNRMSSDSLFLELISLDLIGNEVTLVANRDGYPIFKKAIRINNKKDSFGIPLKLFPPGVVYFELLDKQGNRVSYRPVFIERIRQPFVTLNGQAIQLENQRGLNLTLGLSDENGNPFIGELSVAVLAGDVSPETDDFSIYSNVMFLSEPSDRNDLLINAESLKFTELLDLQHLFLIAGKYPFYAEKEARNRNYIRNEFGKTYGINIRGIVKDPNTRQPAPSVSVQLNPRIGSKKPIETIADENGVFEFRQLELPDSALVDITASGFSGGDHPKIELLTPEKQISEYKKSFFSQNQGITEKGKNWKKIKQPKTSKQAYPASVYGNPDQTIVVGDKVAYYNMLQLLQQRAYGLMITGNSIMFRGPTSINMSNDPMFIVENVVVSKTEFLNLDPRSVQRIELFKGTSAAFFGSRGANGVIVTYLKKSDEPDKAFHEFVLKGFSTPNEFVNDQYLYPEKFGSGKTATVLWKPSLLTDHNGNASLQFIMVPGVSKYKIIVQGVSKNGGVFSGQFMIGK